MEFVTMETIDPQKVVPKSSFRFFRTFKVIFFRWGDRCDDFRILLVLAAIRAISEPEKKAWKASKNRNRNIEREIIILVCTFCVHFRIKFIVDFSKEFF